MAIIFKYCDDWKSAILECPRCGWKGTFDRGAVEHYEELMDSSCPNCPWLDAPMLAIVDCAPTIEESEQNWSRLSESERAHVTARKEFLQRLRAAELKSPDQLPEVEGPDLTIVWDHIEDAKHDRMTVLRHDADEIWREPAVYEGYERFREVVDILRHKYGARLRDVVPTPASELYLLGDKFSANDDVQATRKALKAGELHAEVKDPPWPHRE